jgi:predicted DNA-binding protein
MNSKDSQESSWVTLTVRVTPETAQAIKAVADRCYRPVAAEVRRLIEERIEQDDAIQREAA